MVLILYTMCENRGMPRGPWKYEEELTQILEVGNQHKRDIVLCPQGTHNQVKKIDTQL